jgi:hypothetical protein
MNDRSGRQIKINDRVRTTGGNLGTVAEWSRASGAYFVETDKLALESLVRPWRPDRGWPRWPVNSPLRDTRRGRGAFPSPS